MSLTESQARLLISGYIGNNAKTFKLEIPSELIEIIFILYYIVSLKDLCYDMNDEWDKWDEQTKHDAYLIMSEPNKITRENTGMDPFIFGSKMTNTGINSYGHLVLDLYHHH